jgi:hypothetical protein
METEILLPCSKEPAIGHYREPDESSPHPYLTSLSSILILSYLHLGLLSDRGTLLTLHYMYIEDSANQFVSCSVTRQNSRRMSVRIF